MHKYLIVSYLFEHPVVFFDISRSGIPIVLLPIHDT